MRHNVINISSRYGDSSVAGTKNEAEIMVPVNLNNGEGVNNSEAQENNLELSFAVNEDDDEKR